MDLALVARSMSRSTTKVGALKTEILDVYGA